METRIEEVKIKTENGSVTKEEEKTGPNRMMMKFDMKSNFLRITPNTHTRTITVVFIFSPPHPSSFPFFFFVDWKREQFTLKTNCTKLHDRNEF